MPPKASKSEQKQREKIAVDKTFGMKNKNKSKVVQKYIQNINQNVKVGTGGKTDAEERKAKETKQKEMANKALMNSLFNMSTDKKGRAFDPAAKKKAKQEEDEAIAAGKKLNDELRKEIIEGIANSIRLSDAKKGVRMSELGGHAIINALKQKHADTFRILQLLLFIKANDAVFWVSDPDDNNPIIRCKEDVDAEVEPDERPIEEIIEERRRALPPGGTPVTKESFQAWKEKREADRLAQIEAERAASTSKKANKSAGLSGKDLFHFDASLFVDDADAVSADEYDDRPEDPPDSDNEGGAAARGDKGQASDGEEAEPEADDGEGSDAEEQVEETGGAASSSAAASSTAAAGQSGDRSAGSRKQAVTGEADAAAASNSDAGAVPINKELFMADVDDLPDDFDDED